MAMDSKTENGGSGKAKVADFQGKIMVGNTTAQNCINAKVVKPAHATPRNDRSKASLAKG